MSKELDTLGAVIKAAYEGELDTNALTDALKALIISATQPGHTHDWSVVLNTPTTLAGYGITDAATFAQGQKVDLITITQPVDLDAMETRLNELDAAVVIVGEWDASIGTFPVSVNAGQSWIVSVGGTVDGVVFNVDDRIVAIVDGASTTVYDGNWHHMDYTDKVVSVAGRTGAVVITRADIADFGNYTNWDTAFGWGNHAGLYSLVDHEHAIGEITGFTDNSTTWDAAYGWGDHAGLYSLLAHDHSGVYSPVGHEHYSGFVDRADSTLSFTDLTRTFEIAPVAADYTYWYGLTLYTVSAPDSVVIPDTEGLHFIYYDGATLSQTTTFTEALITDYTLVAVIYWDADNSECLILGDERHGYQMSPSTHLYNHNTLGSRFGGGFGLGDMDVDGSGNDETAAQLSVADGVMWDEDIRLAVTGGSPQTLATIAELPLFYLEGATGLPRKLAATQYPITTTGSGRAAWNEWTGATWQLTEVGSGNFLCAHLFVTNDQPEPVAGFIGQAEYNTVSLARAGAVTELQNLSAGLLADLVPEFVAIATVIFETRNTYSNAVKSRVRSTDSGADYLDWRDTSAASGSTGLSAHTHPASDILGIPVNEGLAILADEDELELVTTGQWRLAQAMTLAEVRIEIPDAPTGSVAEFDLSHNGTSVFSTLVTVDDGETTSVTATIPAVLAITALLDNALMIATVTAVGSTFAGAGFKIRLLGEAA